MTEEELVRKAQQIGTEVADEIAAAVVVATGADPSMLEPEDDFLQLLDQDIEKAVLILEVLEERMGMTIPVDKKAFLEEFNLLKDLIDFFISARLRKEGLHATMEQLHKESTEEK